MHTHVLLLRGINLGPRRRVAMPELRRLLTGAGYRDPLTYLQSGNVVLSSEQSPEALAGECRRLISERFGFDIDVLVRTREELSEIVQRNPLGEVATNPKRYQVSFLSEKPGSEVLDGLERLATPPERLVALGREIYAWHPDGVARSRLWANLAGSGLGVTATARNWTTVTSLLAMASEG
jgi:uncharacterized protein (DUF1697 family)